MLQAEADDVSVINGHVDADVTDADMTDANVARGGDEVASTQSRHAAPISAGATSLAGKCSAIGDDLPACVCSTVYPVFTHFIQL